MSNKRALVDCDAEFRPGDRRTVDVDGAKVAVVNHDGDYYAILNRCAHDGGELCEGHVHGALTADWSGPGDRTEETFDDDPAIACPLHGWEYDLATGEHVGDDSIRLPTWDVVVEDGRVYLER